MRTVKVVHDEYQDHDAFAIVLGKHPDGPSNPATTA
jgi:hypothetical protein